MLLQQHALQNAIVPPSGVKQGILDAISHITLKDVNQNNGVIYVIDTIITPG